MLSRCLLVIRSLCTGRRGIKRALDGAACYTGGAGEGSPEPCRQFSAKTGQTGVFSLCISVGLLMFSRMTRIITVTLMGEFFFKIYKSWSVFVKKTKQNSFVSSRSLIQRRFHCAWLKAWNKTLVDSSYLRERTERSFLSLSYSSGREVHLVALNLGKRAFFIRDLFSKAALMFD